AAKPAAAPANAAASAPAPRPTAAAAAKAALLAPAVRKLVAEHGLEPAEIPATGKAGRVTKGDVLSFVDARGKQSGASAAPANTAS
ncbi:MAG: E3 binding domain-containing protein, partial [Dongiaceae bacterium]